jgi:hypothetical protein
MTSPSHLGHIETIYRATFTVPDDIADQFRHTQEYKDFVSTVDSKGDITSVSGSNSYAATEEWCESMRLETCENFIRMWHNRCLEWAAVIREAS